LQKVMVRVTLIRRLGIRIHGLNYSRHPKRGETPIAGMPVIVIKTRFY